MDTSSFDEQLALELLGDPFFTSHLGKGLMLQWTVQTWWTASHITWNSKLNVIDVNMQGPWRGIVGTDLCAGHITSECRAWGFLGKGQ
jgi:hypothetical protein